MKTFQEIYDGRPDKREVGSSGYSNMKNLYTLCSRLQPELIVESGTWKGNSSWLFHHFCDNVWCFDLDFSNLLWESKQIKYVECDIEEDHIQEYTFNDDWSHTLFFFDDHISHLQRLTWLIEIGAKYAVWDDNQPEAIAKTLKNPPSPCLEELREHFHPIMDKVKHYEVMPFHGDRRNFDTRLTYIEL